MNRRISQKANSLHELDVELYNKQIIHYYLSIDTWIASRTRQSASMLKDFEEDLEKNGYWEDMLTNYYKHGINYVTDYKEE